ncbi:MAG: roadblock/LC7 domain-containing protein [Nanoarchaeota archaeon]|nr:roadblock/LC7 domain-containing protein [Nanoarchaeota archaeon]
MPNTKKDQLVEILQTLKKIGEVLGSSIISRDGLTIASDLSQDIDEETFAAMSAAMQGAAETAVSELKQGNLRQIIVDAQKGKIITLSAGERAILVILAKSKINLGLVLLEMSKASGKISGVLGG